MERGERRVAGWEKGWIFIYYLFIYLVVEVVDVDDLEAQDLGAEVADLCVCVCVCVCVCKYGEQGRETQRYCIMGEGG
jgi:hypothetical protein